MKSAAAALLLLALSGFSGTFTVRHYSASLFLDFEHKSIQGSETILLQPQESALQQIELDANEIIVESVSASALEMRFEQTAGKLRIYFERTLPRKRPVMLTIKFHGSPTRGLLFRDDTAYTVYNTSHWIVVNHVPADLATLRLELNVPANKLVVANGENVGSKRIGDRLLSRWDEKRPTPDFVFGFAVGPFKQAGAAPLCYFSSKFDSEKLAQIFRATPAAFQFFSNKAGVPYPSAKYSQVLVPGNPKQELGDFTLLPENYGDELLAHPEEEWLLAHELAHQWWGIGLACREWPEFWLNEGVASFMADVFLGERYGKARYDREIELARKQYEDLRGAGRDHPLCYRAKAEGDVGGGLPYAKGAWVLHLLKQDIGEEAFWRAFKDYTRKNWQKTVTSKDLQQAMERAAGHPLNSFFDKWIYN